ncbi:MAG: family 16 glycosylhydrolase [Omnitrophica WOR_2 bacterium]
MYKFLLFCYLVISAMSVLSQPQASKTNDFNVNWNLVFSDEFNSPTLDKKKWITWFPYTNDGSDQCAFCRTHGNENQVFLDENVVIIDSVLHIVAKNEKATWFNEERNYTSGMIHARTPFGMGYYEIRAKMPAGKGFWPGIWTFGQISAEIDIMEAGMQNPFQFHTSVHNWLLKKMYHKKNKVKFDLSKDFHKYAMEWDTNFIKFFIDDKQVWQLCKYSNRRGRNIKNCDNNRRKKYLQPVFPAANEKLFMIVGMGIGNETTPFTKTPDAETVFPNSLQVDYIRIYSKKTTN